MEYTEHQEALLKKLDDLQSAKKLSQQKLSDLLGISSGTLSLIRRNKYNADPSSVFEVIENYFSVKNEAELTYTEIEYAPTSISTRISEIIRVCQVKGGLAVACGDAGIGKTKAAQRYVKDNPTNSVLITINPCITSIRSLLRELADRLGADQKKSSAELWKAVVGKLSDGMVLIFDEAQHLTNKTIEVLRSFSDYYADRGQTLGICFIGNIDTVSRFGGKRAEFAQIANRTKQRRLYLKTDIKREDIALLFPILADKGMDREIEFLLRIARTPQALRGAINLFSNAYDNEDYSYKGLVAMAKFMEMEV